MKNLKSLLLMPLMVLVVLFGSGSVWGQNAIVGTGFSNGWGGSCSSTGIGGFKYLSAANGSTYMLSTVANGTGNQYWRFGIDWSGTTNQWTNTSGSDVTVSPNTKYSLTRSCTTSGALLYNVPNTTDNYIFKTLDAGTNPTGTWVFFRVQGTVRSISSLTQPSSTIVPGGTAAVSVTLDGALATGQAAWLRYSTDNFTNSTCAKMTLVSGSTYTVNIPTGTNTANATVKYYAFTSGDGSSIAHADVDLYTINLFNNGGSNYSYTVASNFYSKSSGSAALQTLSNWGTATDGTGTAPVDFAQAGVTYNIRNNATPTIGANWTVSGASSKIIVGDGTNACNFTIPTTLIVTSPATDVSSNGTITRTTSGANSWGTLTFASGAKYVHNASGGTLPSATWNSNSTLQIDANLAADQFTQSFGNVTVNNTAAFFISTTSATYTGSIQGNFTHNSSGAISLKNTTYDATFTIGGNLSITGGGTFRIMESVGTAISRNQKIIVNGNFSLSSGTLNLSNETSSTISTSSVFALLEVKGNFTHTAGTISETATDADVVTRITLTGTTGTQTIESTGQTGLIDFNVAGSNAQCVVSATKTFVLSSTATMTIANGTSAPDLLVDGTFRNAASTTVTGTITFSSTGTYEHNIGGAGAVPTATWNATSLCKIISCGASLPTGLGQNFGNFEWANSTHSTANIQMSAVMTSIQGSFTVSNTGTGSLRYNAGTPASPTFSIGGNLIVSGGTFDLNSAASTPTFNVSGNFNQSGGTISRSGTGTTTINFNKASGTQTFSQSGGSMTATANWTIGTGSTTNTLELATNVNLGTGTGTLTVANGSALDLKGFALTGSFGATINGTGVSNSGAFYTSTGSPSFGRPITLGTSALIKSSGTSLTLTGGVVTASGKNLTIDGTGSTTFSTAVISGAGSVVKNGAGNLTYSFANTYTGSTTLNAGTLTLGVTTAIATAGTGGGVILNGGTYSSGASTGFTVGTSSLNMGTLTLTENTALSLGTGSHSLYFAASNAVSWTAGKTLAITSWSGSAGTSGTAGKIFIGSTASLTSGQLAQITINGLAVMQLSSGEIVPSSTIYESITSGNWGTAATWRSSTNNGSTWTNPATVAPSSSDGTITILNGHNVTITASATIDQTTINAGGTITVNSLQTLTIADGDGTDFSLTGTLVVNGTITNNGQIVVNSGGLYNHANGTSLPSGVQFGTNGSAGTLEVSGSATCTNVVSVSGANELYHLIWSSSGNMGTAIAGASTTLTLCNGDFTMSNGNLLAVSNTTGLIGNISTLNVIGNVNLSGGTIEITDNGGSSTQGVGQITVSGSLIMTGGILDFSNTGNSAVTHSRLNVAGNFTHTAGIIRSTTPPSNTPLITLNGSTVTQTLESTGQTSAVNFNVAGSNAQCVIAATKTFVLSSGSSFTVGTGSSVPDLSISGTFVNSSTTQLSTTATTGTWAINDGGNYIHNTTALISTPLDHCTINSGSTFTYRGSSSLTPASSFSGRTYHNLSFESSSGTWTNPITQATALIINGNLTVGSGVTVNFNNTGTPGNSIKGNISVAGTLSFSPASAGTVNLNGTSTQTISGAGTITTGANSTLLVGASSTIDFGASAAIAGSGTFQTSSGSTLITANTLGINGSLTLTTKTLNAGTNYTYNNSVPSAQVTGAAVTSVNNITINNTAGVTLSASTAVAGTLTLTNGSLTLAANDLTLGASATVSGAGITKYVITNSTGQLKRSSLTTAFTFPVGNSAYNPIILTNTGTSDTYGIIAKDGTVPNAVDGAKAVNRYWAVTEGTAGAGNLAVTAQFNTADGVGASYATTTNPQFIGLYPNASPWTQVSSGAAASGSDPYTVSASGFTNSLPTSGSTYYFAVGTLGAFLPLAPTITASGGVVASLPGSSTSGYVGNTITINGTGLASVTVVKVGGSGGTSVTILSQTATTLTFAAINLGGFIYVENPGGNTTSTESYINLGYITTATGAWSTAGTWLGGAVPASTTTTDVTIAHNVTSTAGTTNVGKLTVNASTTLTITASTTVNINTASTNSGTITNNGTLSTAVTYTNSGTMTMNGAFQLNSNGWATGSNFVYGATGTLNLNASTTYSVSNTDVFWPTSNGPFNVSVLQGGLTLTSSNRTVAGTFATAAGVTQTLSTLTISGTNQLNSGGFFNSAPTYSGSATLIYNNTGTYGINNEWTGNATTAGSGVPFNVTIQNATTLTFPSSDRGIGGNFNVTSGGATLNATSGDLYVGGNFTNNGTFTHNTRAVFLNGTTQTLGGSNINGSATTNCFPYLILQNGTNVTLAASAAVTNTLTLTSGKITLSTFDLNIGASTISGASASNYIVTNSTGQLKRTVTTAAVSFPVGNSAYNPITLTNAGTSDSYGIRVADGAPANAADALVTVQRSWYITEAVAGGSDLTPVVAQYNSGDVGSNYNAGATPYMGLYNGATWSQVPTTLGGSITATSTGTNQFPATIPAGSYIAIGKDAGLSSTPPTISSFSATSGYSGSSIVISGTNFTGTTAVTFGGTAAASFTVDNANQITAIVGTGGTSGSVSVTTPSGSVSLVGFTYLGFITTSGATNWNTGASWLGGAVPTSNTAVTIADNLNITAAFTNTPIASITVNTGITATASATVAIGTVTNAITTSGTGVFTFSGAGGSIIAGSVVNGGTLSWSAAATLNISAGGTLTNNGTFTRGTGTVNFVGSAGTINGSNAITFNNLTNNSGGLTLTTVPTIDGTFQLNGGFVSAAPIYTSNSTLYYNLSYNRANEWSATGIGTIGTTAGYPNNVTINTGTFDIVNGSNTARALNGTLTVNTGASFNLNALNAALTIGGGLTTVGTGAFNMGTTNAAVTVAGAITNSGSLTLSSILGGDIYVAGNFTNNGTFTHNTRAVFLNGTAQTVSGSALNTSGTTNCFDYLFIQNNSQVTLGAAVTVRSNLNFTSGDIILSTFNLTLASGATITGASSANYVITNSTGMLVRTLATSTAVTFPIGNSAYNPITISQSGASDVYSLRMIDGSISGLSPNDVTRTINRRWSFSRTNSANVNIAVSSISYNTGEENNSTNFNGGTQPYFGLYNGTSWVHATASQSSQTYTSANTVASSTATSFSLAMGKDVAFLPAAPTVTSVDVASAYSGSTIVITGTSFTGATAVSFGGTAAASYTVNSATQITAVVGTGGASGDVSVTTPSGTGSLTGGFTYLGFITTSGASDWNTAGSWLGGVVPTANNAVTVAHNLSIAAAFTNSPIASITVNTGITATASATVAIGTVTNAITTVGTGVFTFTGASGSITTGSFVNAGTLSWSALATLNISASGTLTNNGTFTRGTGTVVFANAGTVNGSNGTTFNNLTLTTGVLSFATTPTIAGTFALNGGNISTNAPIYTNTSTLQYGLTYSRFLEWSATGVGTIGTTQGYPNNVTISSGTFTVVNSDAGTARAIAGNLQVNTGCTFTTGALNAVLTIGGSLTTTGTGNFNMSSSNAAVTVVGSVSNAGTLALSSTVGGDLNVAGNWTNTGTFTPNSRAVTFNGTAAQAINSATTFAFLTITNSVADVTAAAAITVTSNLTINGSATLTRLNMQANTLTLTGATSTITSGFLRSAVSITTGTNTFGANGTYEHNLNSGTVLTATWNSGSTCAIIGMTALPPGGLTQNFSNFTWNSNGQTSAAGLGGALTSIGGNLTIINSNTKEVRLVAPTTATTAITIGGNIDVQSSGILAFVNASSNNAVANNQTLTVTGTVNVRGSFFVNGSAAQTGAGVVTLNANGGISTSGTFEIAGNTSSSIINIGGNFNQSGGSFQKTNATPTPTINFNNASLSQTFTQSSGTISGSINWNIGTGSSTNTVQLASNVNLGTGTGTFTVLGNATFDAGTYVLSGSAASTFNSGANIITANTGGVNGSVTLSGTRTYNAAANYTFNNSTPSAQVTGAAVTAANNITLNNSAGVSLSAGTTVSGALTLTSGKLTIGANTLTLNGSVASMSASNSLVGSSTSNLTIGGTGALGTLFFDQTTSGTTNALQNVTINRTSTGSATLGNALNVGGTLTLTNGIVTTTSTNSLTITSSLTGAISGGSSTAYINGPLDRTLAASTNYAFPIGGNSSNYRPVSLNSVSVTSNPVVRVTVSETGATTADGTTLSSLLNARNWSIEQITGTFTSATLVITESGITNGTHEIGKSNSNQAGTYVSCGEPQTVSSGTITSTSGQGVGFYAIGVKGCTNPTSGGTIAASQTICYEGDPAAFSSSAAASGNVGTLEYKWQYSSSSDFSSDINDIASTNSATYDASSGLTATRYYRRLSRVSCSSDWTGAVVSNILTVTVNAVFASGEVSATGQTICSGGTPTEIGSTTAASGGDATITYSWRSSSDSYTAAIDGATSATYTPPSGLTATTSYRRYAKDGTCNITPTVSTGTWTVTVNSIPSAPTASAQSFCSASSPTIASLQTTSGTSIKWYDAVTSGNLLSSGTALTTGTYYASQTASSCESSRTSVAVTINSNGTWIGGATGNWDVAENWCGGVPDQNTEIATIPSGVTVTVNTSPTILTYTLASGSTVNLGNNIITIADGGSFTNNGTFNAGTGTGTVVFAGAGTLGGSSTTFNNLSVSGALTVSTSPTVNGTLTLNNGGSIVSNPIIYGASSTLIYNPGGEITSTNNEWPTSNSPLNVTVQNTSNVTLNDAKTINGLLTLTSGDLIIGSNNLTLGSSATVSSASASSHINATSTGEARKIYGGSGSFTFPVGDGTNYTPATVNFTSAGSFNGETNDYLGVRLKTSKVTGMNSNNSNYISRSWFIEPHNSASGFTYTVNLSYTDNDVVGTESEIRPVKLSSGVWQYPGDASFDDGTQLTGTSGSISTSTNVLTWSGLTSFSEFGGGGLGGPLPVELLSFNAFCEDDIISLSWSTASEQNSSHFNIEKSINGIDWRVIGTVMAAGNSTEEIDYSFIDSEKSNGNKYYRLNQVDIDGDNKIYDPIFVDCEGNGSQLITYPNPSKDGFNIVISDSKLVGESILIIRDAMGKVIIEKSISIEEGINLYPISSTELQNGIYFITIENQNAQSKTIKHSKN